MVVFKSFNHVGSSMLKSSTLLGQIIRKKLIDIHIYYTGVVAIVFLFICLVNKMELENLVISHASKDHANQRGMSPQNCPYTTPK